MIPISLSTDALRKRTYKITLKQHFMDFISMTSRLPW